MLRIFQKRKSVKSALRKNSEYFKKRFLEKRKSVRIFLEHSNAFSLKAYKEKETKRLNKKGVIRRIWKPQIHLTTHDALHVLTEHTVKPRK